MPRKGNKQGTKKPATTNKPGVKKEPPKQKPQKTNLVPRHTVADLLEEFRKIIGDNAFLATNVLMEVYHDFSDHKQFGAFLNYSNPAGKVWGTGRQPYKEQALIGLLFLVVPTGNENYGSVRRLSEILSDPTTSWTDMLSATNGLEGVGRIAKIFLGDGQYRSKAHAAEDEAGLFLTLDTQFRGNYKKGKYDEKSPEITNWFERTANDLDLKPVPMKDGQSRRMLWCIADILPPLNTPARDAASPPVTYYIDPSLVSFFDPGVGHSSKTLSRGQARVRELHPQTLNFHTPAPRSLTIMQTTDGGLDVPFVGEYIVALYSINTGNKLDEHVLPSSSFQDGTNPNQISQVMGAIRKAYQFGDTGDFDPEKCIVDEAGAARYLIFFRRKALGDSCQSHYCDVLSSEPVAVDVEPPAIWNPNLGFVASKGQQGAYSLYSGTDFGGNSVGPQAPPGFNSLVANTQEWDSVRFNSSAGSVFFTVDLLSGALGSLHTCSVTCINTHKRIIQVSSQEGAQKEIRIQEQITRDVGKYLGIVIKGLDKCGMPTNLLRRIISSSRRNPGKALAAPLAAAAGVWLSSGGQGGEDTDTDAEQEAVGLAIATPDDDTGDASTQLEKNPLGNPESVRMRQIQPTSGDQSKDEATPEGQSQDQSNTPETYEPSPSARQPTAANTSTDVEPNPEFESDEETQLIRNTIQLAQDQNPSTSDDRTEAASDSGSSVDRTDPSPGTMSSNEPSSGNRTPPLEKDKPPEGSGTTLEPKVASAQGSGISPAISGRGVELVTIIAPAQGRLGKIIVDTQHGSMSFTQKADSDGKWSTADRLAIERFLARLSDREETGYLLLEQLITVLDGWARRLRSGDSCPAGQLEIMDQAVKYALEAENILGTLYVSWQEDSDGSGSLGSSSPIKMSLSDFLFVIREAVQRSARASNRLPLEISGRSLQGGTKATRRKRRGGKARKTRRRGKRPKTSHTRRRAQTRKPSKTKKLR